VVLKEVTPLEMLELALIENIQRQDLNSLEEALAYQALISDFGLTQEQVAKQVGKDRSDYYEFAAPLATGPQGARSLDHATGSFTEGHARALVGIASEEDQIAAMGKIITLELNVRQAEDLAKRIKASSELMPPLRKVLSATPPRRSPDIADLEAQFRDALTVKVDLKYNAKGTRYPRAPFQ